MVTAMSGVQFQDKITWHLKLMLGLNETIDQ